MYRDLYILLNPRVRYSWARDLWELWDLWDLWDL